jgi:hypothetical protein
MLVGQGDIEVYAIQDGGLTNEFLQFGGMYRSNSDRLLLFYQTNLLVLKTIVMHEVMHAVQDWLDELGRPSNALEADAYIAGALALRSLDPKMKPNRGSIYRVAYDKAVPIVLDRDAKPSNQAWKKANWW